MSAGMLYILCDTFPQERWISIYLSQIRSQEQTKVQKPPKSNLVNTWVLLRLLTGVCGKSNYTQLQSWKPIPARLTGHKSWVPGAHCITCRQLSQSHPASFMWLPCLRLCSPYCHQQTLPTEPHCENICVDITGDPSSRTTFPSSSSSRKGKAHHSPRSRKWQHRPFLMAGAAATEKLQNTEMLITGS